MPVNNSKSNLVNLVYCDHVLAHCYMSLASNSKYYESANIDAIIAILNNNYGERFGFNYTSIEEFVADFDEVKDILKCNHTVSDEQKLKLVQIRGGIIMVLMNHLQDSSQRVMIGLRVECQNQNWLNNTRVRQIKAAIGIMMV